SIRGSAMPDPQGQEDPTRRSKRVLKRFVRHPSAIVGSLIILLVVVSAIFAPFLTPHELESRNIRARFSPPNETHLLGTDNFGRDTLTRILHGGRVSLRVALLSVGIAATM